MSEAVERTAEEKAQREKDVKELNQKHDFLKVQ